MGEGLGDRGAHHPALESTPGPKPRSAVARCAALISFVILARLRLPLLLSRRLGRFDATSEGGKLASCSSAKRNHACARSIRIGHACLLEMDRANSKYSAARRRYSIARSRVILAPKPAAEGISRAGRRTQPR
jgi:hypothetical protein